ncbi:hypothetical protein ACWCPT_21495 [Streptomyces sp. NPDC002308]
MTTRNTRGRTAPAPPAGPLDAGAPGPAPVHTHVRLFPRGE